MSSSSENEQAVNPAEVLKNLTALYVEDDVWVREQTAEVLAGFFHTLLLASDGPHALELFHRHSVHLIITDIKMPGMSGIELAAEIRRHDRRLPIFITSSYSESDDLMQAVRLNLVDYLTKPLSYARLKEALTACAQRIIDEGRAFVRIDERTRYWPASGELLRDGRPVPLTAKESALLSLLVRQRGRMVSKERIADVVWPDADAMSEPALKNLVLKLRNKLGRELTLIRQNSSRLEAG